jgi:NAD(P)H-dependent FMN reductase
MHYVIISGSTRENSQSFKVAQWLATQIESDNADNTTDIINLYKEDIPIWNDTAWNSDSELSKHMKQYKDRVSKSDGLILISPEWHGMVPGGLKNFLLYISSQHVAHKPCLLVGVSGSIGGAYPIAELRMSGYKNNRMTYIPDHLIVRNVEEVMNDHNFDIDDGDDKYTKERAAYSLNVLYAYAGALGEMRKTHDLLDKRYPNGM